MPFFLLLGMQRAVVACPGGIGQRCSLYVTALLVVCTFTIQ